MYEFQTATVCELDQLSSYIKNKCLEYSEKYSKKAIKVPVLPKVVSFDSIKDNVGKTKELVIGINKENLEICTYDFHKNYSTIVTALDIEQTKIFATSLISQYLYLNQKQVLIINADDDCKININNNNNCQFINSNYNEVFNNLYKMVNEQNEKYKLNNYNKNIFDGKKSIVCFIIGIDHFRSKLNDDNKNKFGELFTLAKNLGIIEFVLVDSIDKFKKMELESWYKSSISNTDGIWIGNGINDQFSLKVSQKIPYMKEDIPDSFCFVIKRGKPTYVKYVEDFGK